MIVPTLTNCQDNSRCLRSDLRHLRMTPGVPVAPPLPLPLSKDTEGLQPRRCGVGGRVITLHLANELIIQSS